MSDLDEARLVSWLSSRLGHPCSDFAVRKFPGGQSNPTYLLTLGDRRLVLRRKPFGDILPSAHAVDREFRLLSRLYPCGFPVPEPIALCEDTGVIGSVFYVMAHVDGRSLWDGRLPGLSCGDRRQIYETLVVKLAHLHSIDPIKAGLSEFGRKGDYFERQIGRWTKQYRAAETEIVPEMDRLINWLPQTRPSQSDIRVTHGDYRIDNAIFAHNTPVVKAVIDWELATLGDPLADFAYFAMNWVIPVDGKSGLAGTDLGELNIPTLTEVCQLYAKHTGREEMPELHWYFAYNLFRLAGIVQGIKRRFLNGNASNDDAAKTAERVIPLACAAWEQAELAGA